MQIREIQEQDAEAFLEHLKRLDRETSFMLMERDERRTSPEDQRKRIQAMRSGGSQTILLAEQDGGILGHVAVLGGSYQRNRRTAHLVIGILQSSWGRGLGASLMSQAEAWARRHGIHRLELTVMDSNKRALALYTRCGFRQEGLRRHALFVDGAFVDERYMAKLLEEDRPSP